jgi:Uma2 family endonuclease
LSNRTIGAKFGVPEVWIVDLSGSALEVYRDPSEGSYASSCMQRGLRADGR